MHLLYLDDSGSIKNKSEDYIVLGGISIFESQAYFLSNELDQLAQTIDPKKFNDIEFHASEIFSRRSWPWKEMKKDEAIGVIKAVLKIVSDSYNSTNLFACAIHKDSYPPQDEAMNVAFEDLCQRFDFYLSNLNSSGERQKGLLILDESSHETTLQNLANNFRQIGTQWGNIRNLADTPFFVNSKASRMIQIADHIAYSVFRRYNQGDAQYFDIISHRFYENDNVLHGLAHKQKIKRKCMCPACTSRRH
ncbi:MAG: DUF3800 domain-containing protein [Cyclobacteriaceae bacterium]